MTRRTRYSQEVRERSVRMVLEHRGEYASEWAAIQSVASKIGCSAETLRNWVRRTQVDTGSREGVTSEERARVKDLEREVREPIGDIPPVEFEAMYYARQTGQATAVGLN